MSEPNSVNQQIGAYRLYDRIGRGGFATVYLARDVRTNEIVAVKILHSHIAQDAEFIARFRREAEALHRIPSDPNLVHLHEFGQANGHWFLAMDYLEGKDLAQILAERKRLPVNQALAITTQIARALDVAHRNGLIHRDIKPANIKLTPNGVVKVMDFGLSRAAEGTRLTQSSMFIGTPDYMAPEIWEGKPADIRADLYALGALTYEMLAGGAPFHSQTPAAIMRRHLVENPAPLRAVRPDVPPRVEAIVHKLMAKQPEARFQTPGEVRVALRDESVDAGLPVAAPRSALSESNRLTLWLAVFGIVLFGFSSILVMLGLSGQSSNVPPSTPDEFGFVSDAPNVTRTPRATFTVKPLTAETDVVAISAAVITVTNTPTPPPTPTPTSSATATRTRLRETIVQTPPTPTVTPVPPFKRLDPSAQGSGLYLLDGVTNSSALLNGAFTPRSAVWSPGGERILVTFDLNGGYAMQLLDSNGGENSMLAVSSDSDKLNKRGWLGNYSHAIFSPDGRRIAFWARDVNDNACPFIADANGTELRRLENCERDDYPRFWSVDGKWIVTWSPRNGFAAYQADGDKRVPLAQLNGIEFYDSRYYPWRVIREAKCTGTNFWSCVGVESAPMPTVQTVIDSQSSSTVDAPLATLPPESPLPIATATPLGGFIYPKPVLSQPENDFTVSGCLEYTFSWQWDGALGSDEYFDVRIWKDDSPNHFGAYWVREPQIVVAGARKERVQRQEWWGYYFVTECTPLGWASAGTGKYHWAVAIVRGHSGQVEQQLSPESESRIVNYAQ